MRSHPTPEEISRTVQLPPGAKLEFVMPEPGGVVMVTVPDVGTTIRATLKEGMTLALPQGDPLTAKQGETIIKLLERIDVSLARLATQVPP